MEDLLHFMAQQSEAIRTLQQQLVVQNTPKPEVAASLKFDRTREAVVEFVNVCRLYAEARLGGVKEKEKISWVLSYVQGGVAEVWKDNVLDEIEKGTSEVTTMKELFEKIMEEFGEFNKESRKADKLRLLVQGPRTCDEYVQEFKRASRESGYEGRALIDEFKRGLNRTIRRRLAEVESPPSTIMEWQERAVKLDRNTRQSRAEEKLLAGTAWSQGTSAPQGGVRQGWPQHGTFRGGWVQRGGWRGGERKEAQPQAPRLTGAETGRGRMAVDWAARKALVTCYRCGKKGHYMAECREGQRIRIAELEKEIEELKGNGWQWAPACPPPINTVFCLLKI